MIRRNMWRAINASRSPTRLRIVDAQSLPTPPASVSLAVARSLDAALARLELGDARSTLLVPDWRSTGAPGPRATYAVASILSRSGAVTLGLPDHLGQADRRRWSALAQAAGADIAALGATSWNRVRFGEQSLILETADYPAELYQVEHVVALSAPEGSGSIALWSEYVHPNTALRARVAGFARLELAAGVAASYVLVGQIDGRWFAVHAAPALPAELVARAIECARARRHGYETPGPWEDAGIQHLSGLTRQSLSVDGLVPVVRLADNDGERLARQLGELLGWHFASGDHETRNASGEG